MFNICNIFNISNIFNIFRVAHGKTGSLVLVFMSTSLLSGGFSGNPHCAFIIMMMVIKMMIVIVVIGVLL